MALVGESKMKKTIYIVSKYLLTRYILTTKGYQRGRGREEEDRVKKN